MTDDELTAEFDAARGRRGKARDTALAAFLAHGDAVIPVLARAMEDENKSRRELAHALLRERTPASDPGREALARAVAALWRSSRVATRVAAFELAPRVGERALPTLREPLAELVRGEYDADVLRAALELAPSLRLAPDALRTTIEPALDHWSTPLRARARELLGAAGVAAPASRWDDCPLADAVVQHIQRLGGRPLTFDRAAPLRPPACSWASNVRPGWRDADPLGQLVATPATVEYVDRHIEWTRGRTFGTWDRDFPDRTLDLTATSENADTDVGGHRRLLYAIGYCSLQYYYCLDLLTASDDPPVYVRDHGSCDAYAKFPSLSKFLAWLKTP